MYFTKSFLMQITLFPANEVQKEQQGAFPKLLEHHFKSLLHKSTHNRHFEHKF